MINDYGFNNGLYERCLMIGCSIWVKACQHLNAIDPPYPLGVFMWVGNFNKNIAKEYKKKISANFHAIGALKNNYI